VCACSANAFCPANAVPVSLLIFRRFGRVHVMLLLLHAFSANGLVEETHTRILNRHRGASMDFSCLGSCGEVVLHKHLEFAKYPKAAHILGQRKLHSCTLGVFIYLPPFADQEVNELYSRHYTASQRRLSFAHKRPVAQARFISSVLYLRHLHRVPQFNAVELGCADGYLLARLALSIRSPQVTVTCFEADPAKARLAADNLRKHAPNATSRVVNAPFNVSLFTPHSIDLVVSSQVFEHISKPCETLNAIRLGLRDGGHVFTDIPKQDTDHLKQKVHGVFHASFFNGSTFNAMMSQAGFDLVASDSNSNSKTRQIHRMGLPSFAPHSP
jgi:2-polyprenyl-3-methyl-5-hydroxy-6-metoxy-1,4-benzoquinol methylase